MVIEFSNCSSATGEKCTSPFENEKPYTLSGKYGMLIEKAMAKLEAKEMYKWRMHEL